MGILDSKTHVRNDHLQSDVGQQERSRQPNDPWQSFGLTVFLKGKLVGGFNPLEKYESNWKSSPNRGENKKYLKPPPRKTLGMEGSLLGKIP